jgi:hypothetical protein
MSTIGIGSLIGILLLIWITFRSFKPIALVALSIAVGFLGALSISWLVFERIHLITLVFGASLIGVAQDYGIYFFCKRLGANDQLDSWRLLRQILPALILTLVTTLIGYFSLVLTPFPGLRQMALFSAVGLIFAWFTVAFWFPTLVHASTLKIAPSRSAAALTRRAGHAAKNRRPGAALAFAGLAGFGGLQLTVQDDIRSLQNPPAVARRSVEAQQDPRPGDAGAIFHCAAPMRKLLQRKALKERLDRLANRIGSAGTVISNWAFGANSAVAASVDRSVARARAGTLAPGGKARRGQELVSGARADYSHRRRRSPSRSFSVAGDDREHLWLGQVAISMPAWWRCVASTGAIWRC